MTYDTKHHVEGNRRVSAKIGQMPSYMNSTKWRELFCIAARYNLSFTIAWVGDTAWPKEALQSPVPERLIEEDGIRDLGIGGPCLYRDILWIRFPFIRPSKRWGDFRQDIMPFAAELRSLGKMPVRETEAYFEVRGYDYEENGA